MRESFQVLDRDNDGQVDRADVGEVLLQLGKAAILSLAPHPLLPSANPPSRSRRLRPLTNALFPPHLRPQTLPPHLPQQPLRSPRRPLAARRARRRIRRLRCRR